MAILGNHRRFSLLVTASLLAVVSAFGWLRARPEMSGDAAAHMRRAAAYYDSVVSPRDRRKSTARASRHGIKRSDAHADREPAKSGRGRKLRNGRVIARPNKTARTRAGELTVRLAYALAAGERTVGDQGDAIAAQAAALLRDRALAQADLRDLLRDADGRHVDPLGELVRRRRSRSFVVERPAGEPLDEQVQASAMAAVPRLLESIRALRQATDSG